MLKWVKCFGLATALVVAFTGVTAADGHIEKAIKARKALMQVYAFNLGQLGAMAKGKAEYNAEQAANAANNLLALVNTKNGPMWPQGSDNTAAGYEDKTRALPEIWSTYPKVAEKSKALKDAVAELAKVAGNDLASLQGAIGPVGKGCGGCHKPFRAEKK